MVQVDRGLRGVLTRAKSYDLLQDLLGVEHVRRTLASEYIRLPAGGSVLDIGCGTSGILAHLPDVTYVGFDMNPRYIEAGRLRYGSRGRFVCADVNDAPPEARGSFDRVLAIGLLHHLNDGEALGLMRLAAQRLAPGGSLITFDCCYRAGQHPLARFLIDRDRGQNTRTQSGFVALASQVFTAVEPFLREDLLRVPYTHLIMRCGKPQLAADQ